MYLRHILASSIIAVALTVSGVALAESKAEATAKTDAVRADSSVMISGDEPMNVGDSAQIETPDPSAAAQGKTEAMLQKEAGVIGGNMNPVDEGDAAQLKMPKLDAKAQEATEKSLRKADDEAGAISGKYE